MSVSIPRSRGRSITKPTPQQSQKRYTDHFPHKSNSMGVRAIAWTEDHCEQGSLEDVHAIGTMNR